MANVKGGLMAKQTEVKAAAQQPSLLSTMVNSASVQQRFERMLGKKSAGFLSSLLTIVNDNKLLKNADPRTVLAAAATAASLDLPINPSLGMSYIVPYGGAARFQTGYRGLINLAQRSGKMKSIVMTEVYEGEIQDWNRFTETYTPGERTSDIVVGYFASFELINGFRKSAYWTRDEVLAHAKRFSKSFNNGPWQTDFSAMAKKTVLTSILKTYAPLSIEFQEALEAENEIKSMNAAGDVETLDVDAEEAQTEAVSDGRVVDTETGELFGEVEVKEQ